MTLWDFITQFVEFGIYILVMYDDYTSHGYLEIYLSVDRMLWYYFATMFWKFNYACLELMDEVASKFFIWLYHLRVLSHLEFRVLHTLSNNVTTSKIGEVPLELVTTNKGNI